MKVTLFALNSSFTHTNLAIRYLASSLEDAGFCAHIKEFILKDKYRYILHELVETEADIYAFSVYIWNIKEMLSIACDLKKLMPEAFIIFGGPEVSFENEEFLTEHPYIDVLIKGEGESVIAEICKAPNKYKGKTVVGECSTKFINEGILYDRYPSNGDILYYESSRGCPHRCSYCLSSLVNGIRAKSIEKTLADLRSFEHLPSKPRIIKFIDRTFNYDLKRAKEIWRALCSEEYTLNYHFEITADHLDNEAIEILANMPSGKIQIEAGIQSINKETLKSVNRYCDNRTALKNLTRIKSAGNIHVHADLIAGLPFEDIGSFKLSFDETIGCCHKLQLGFLKMLKGSLIRVQAKQHGYIFETEPPYTVLANNYISYEELYRLTRIAATVDRFYSSDSFSYTMEYVLSKATSPFDFFTELTEMQEKELDKTSQHECRLMLIKILQNDPQALGRLALDTLINENKKPPKELQDHYRECSKDIINVKQENFKGYNSNNLHIYTFDFDPCNYYIIDRNKHISKRCIK